jgi:two-component system NtrC family sensor kinase
MKNKSYTTEEKTFQRIFRYAFESNEDGFAIFNMQGELKFANNSFIKLLGYQDAAEIKGLNMNRFFPEEVNQVLAESIRKNQNGETTKLNDCQAITRNHEIIPVSIYAFAIYNEQNEKMGLMCSLRDISDKRKAYDELKEIQNRYEALFERSLDCLFINDFEGNFIDANPAALNLLGYTREEIPSLNLASMLSQDQLEEAFHFLKEMMKGGHQDKIAEFRLRRKDGQYVYVEIRGCLIYRDGKPYAVQGIARDITERKKAEKKLKEYKLIVDSAQDAIFFKDLESRYIIANDKTFEAFGLPRDKVIGKNDFELMQDREEAGKNIEDDKVVFNTGKPKEITKHMTGADGREYWFQAVKVPQFDDKGKIMGLVGIARDITEQKRAEEALKESEKRFRDVLDNSRDMTYKLNLKGNFEYISPSVHELSGFSAEEFVAMGFAGTVKRIHPEDRVKIKALMKGLFNNDLEDKFIQEVEYRWKVKNGEWRWFSNNHTVIRDENVRPIAIVATARDITERKRTEERLMRLSNAVSMSNDSIVISDLKGKIIEVNKATLEIYGSDDKGDLIGKNSLDLIAPEEREKALAGMKEVLEKGQVRNKEYHIITMDGGKVPVEMNASIMKEHDEKPIGFVGISRDITERKRAEGEIRRLSSAVEQSIDGIAIADMESRLIYVNVAFAHMHGYSPDEMAGMKVENLHNEEQMEKYERGMEEFMTKGSWMGEIGHAGKDGKAFPTYMSITLLRNSEGKPEGIVAVARDITDQKLIEEERENMFRSLAQAEKLASLGQLAGGMAHELNNPISFISANLSVLQEYRESMGQALRAYDDFAFKKTKEICTDKLEKELGELEELKEELDIKYVLDDFHALLAESKQGAERIKRIVQNLREFSDPQSIQTEHTDINASLDKALEILRSEIKCKVRLVKDYGDIPELHVYPQELNQVFLNILANAAQAIQDRGEIKIRTWTQDSMVKVTVRDTGGGMSPEKLARIFDPFYTTKMVGQGTGLGLSTSYGIIKKHGGEIQVESQPGKGTTVTISLPLNNESNQGVRK